MKGYPSRTLAANAGDGLPPDSPRGQHARDVFYAQAFADLKAAIQTQTRMAGRLAGGIVNEVLESGTYVFDASAVLGNAYKVAAGSIEIDNLSATHAVTVVSRSDSTGSAPTHGTGVRIVPAGQFRRIPLASREWAIYGTVAESVSIAVYTHGVGGDEMQP